MTLLQMSFSGAVLILAVVILRAAAIHKLPKRTFLTLWEIVLFRLLIPFSIPSVFSVYSLVNQPAASAGVFAGVQRLPVAAAAAAPWLPADTAPLISVRAGIFSCLQRFHGKMSEGAYAEADRFHPAVRQDFGPPYLWNVTSGHTVAGKKRLGKYTTAGIHSSA